MKHTWKNHGCRRNCSIGTQHFTMLQYILWTSLCELLYWKNPFYYSNSSFLEQIFKLMLLIGLLKIIHLKLSSVAWTCELWPKWGHYFMNSASWVGTNCWLYAGSLYPSWELVHVVWWKLELHAGRLVSWNNENWFT